MRRTTSTNPNVDTNAVDTIFNAETSGNQVSYMWVYSANQPDATQGGPNTNGQNFPNAGTAAPGWLRLAYDGTSSFTGYYYNGTSKKVPAASDPNWVSIGAYTDAMPDPTINLGIADSAHNDVSTNTAMFDDLSTLATLAPIGPLSNELPTTTVLSIAHGATVDLGGNSQQVAALADYALGSGGRVINSGTGSISILTLSPTGGSSTFSGMIQGGGTLGTISLVMNGNGTQVLAGANTYTGGTTVNAGVLQIGQSNALPANRALTVNGGTLDVNGHNAIVDPFNGSGGVVYSSTGGQLTLGNMNGGGTFSGIISGAMSLTKNGTGTIVLGGNNNYSGATTVNNGALILTGAAGNSAMTVNHSAIFRAARQRND